jgi:hypothetical protein
MLQWLNAPMTDLTAPSAPPLTLTAPGLPERAAAALPPALPEPPRGTGTLPLAPPDGCTSPPPRPQLPPHLARSAKAVAALHRHAPALIETLSPIKRVLQLMDANMPAGTSVAGMLGAGAAGGHKLKAGAPLQPKGSKAAGVSAAGSRKPKAGSSPQPGGPDARVEAQGSSARATPALHMGQTAAAQRAPAARSVVAQSMQPHRIQSKRNGATADAEARGPVASKAVKSLLATDCGCAH